MPAQTRSSTRDARDLATSVALRKAQGLLNLPNELIVQFILPELDLKALVHLSQTCRTMHAILGTDEDWQQRAYRSGFTKSLLYKAQSWRALCAALVFHANSCVACAPHFVGPAGCFHTVLETDVCARMRRLKLA